MTSGDITSPKTDGWGCAHIYPDGSWCMRTPDLHRRCPTCKSFLRGPADVDGSLGCNECGEIVRLSASPLTEKAQPK